MYSSTPGTIARPLIHRFFLSEAITLTKQFCSCGDGQSFVSLPLYFTNGTFRSPMNAGKKSIAAHDVDNQDNINKGICGCEFLQILPPHIPYQEIWP